MPYTLRQAAQAVGKSKPTVFRAIQSGRLAAVRDGATGGWLIEADDLANVYPIVPRETDNATVHGPLSAPASSFQLAVIARREIELLEANIADLRKTNAELSRRLDESESERRALAGRSWWRRWQQSISGS